MLTAWEQEEINNKFNKACILLGEEQEEVRKTLSDCSEEEALCLKYLYSYMPVSDMADYSAALFLKFIKHGLKVREIFAWGKSMEDTIFLNYVLQCRINNENIEFYEDQFYKELSGRIIGLSMYEAAIEVNYWCFEKATYQTTNDRTASPLTVLKNAYGRCGEESTLTVAAMRSVGIPARQVYTPRWAHCDDNHAWVEVWIDGNWHFLGACEPESRLDTGWFRLPASRGMLIHNRVFSDLTGEENVTQKTERMTEINILHHYAKTKKIKVRITDEEKTPLHNISVNFEVANYSEFYPIASLKTDRNGEVSFITGLGDLMVYAYNNQSYVYQKIEVREEVLELVLPAIRPNEPKEREFIFVPPVGGVEKERPYTKEEESILLRRNKESSDIRKAYEMTFFDKKKAEKYALKFSEQRQEIAECLISARGNHKEITDFLEDAETKPHLFYKVKMLLSLPKKDLTDCKADILKDHLMGAMEYKGIYEDEIFVPFILSPRIYMEMVTPFRKAVLCHFTKDELESFKNNENKAFEYVDKFVQTYDDREYSNLSVSPAGALRLNKANEISKKILLTAMLRTIGIPAKIRKDDLRISYLSEGRWKCFIEQAAKEPYIGAFLCLENVSHKDTFSYYNNYTVSYLNSKEGHFKMLNLEDVPWQNHTVTYELEPGLVKIVTSNRQPDGTNLVKVYFANLERGETKRIPLMLLEGERQSREVMIPDRTVLTLESNEIKLSQITQSDHTIAAWLQVGAEPTEHLLNEIIECSEKWNSRKPNLVFILKDFKELNDVTLQKTLKAVSCIQIVIEPNNFNIDTIYDDFHISDKKLPLALIMSHNNRASYAFYGYHVGIGEMLLKNIQIE